MRRLAAAACLPTVLLRVRLSGASFVEAMPPEVVVTEVEAPPPSVRAFSFEALNDVAGGVAHDDHKASPPGAFAVDYLALYEEGVSQLPSLSVADPMILAALWSRTGNDTYAAAAADNLAGIATGNAPWLAANRAWADPVNGRQSWIDFDRNTTTFCSSSAPGACHGAGSSGFLGCTEYGLLAYLVLQRGGYDKGWPSKVEADYKAMHSTLCYVWFSGAWNQGTWMGIGNTIFSEAFPEAADETTPWQYPYLTRRQHAEKVYQDYFDQQIMMEDADGYNVGSTLLLCANCACIFVPRAEGPPVILPRFALQQIWVNMMLTWPEVWREGRAQQLASAGTRNLLANFRDYIAPDDQVFQFSSGLGSHYTSMFWLAAMERAATIFQDGTFRFAAQRIWHSLSQQNTTGPDQNMASCLRIPHGKPGSCCPAAGCLPKGGVSSTHPLALVVTTPWMVSYNLLCAGYDPHASSAAGKRGVSIYLYLRLGFAYVIPLLVKQLMVATPRGALLRWWQPVAGTLRAAVGWVESQPPWQPWRLRTTGCRPAWCTLGGRWATCTCADTLMQPRLTEIFLCHACSC
jgi:hypothetical protein